MKLDMHCRHVWRKYRERRSSTASGLPWYRGVCSRDDTAESLHHRPHSSGSQTIQPPTQILSAQDVSVDLCSCAASNVYMYIYIYNIQRCRDSILGGGSFVFGDWPARSMRVVRYIQQ